MESKGTTLKGSEKQVAWAADIKAKMLASIASSRAQYERTLTAYGKSIPAEHDAASARIVDAIKACSSAKTVIDLRQSGLLLGSLWGGPYIADIHAAKVEAIIAKLAC